MTEYLMPAARCQDTGQLLQRQDLRGRRYTQRHRAEALAQAQQLAESLSQRRRQTWTPELITYTV